jgi:hypothetical protein
MRRVTIALNKTNQTYASQEIVDHQQGTGDTQGPGQVDGTLNAELSPGSYALEFAALLRRDFSTVFTAITGAGLTIAASGALWTVTRAAGDFLAGGVKVGMVVRLSVGTLNAANLNKNLVVVGVTATVLTVFPMNGVALVAEGPIAGCTVSAPGKITYAPTTGHTNDYFTWEQYDASVPFSEVFTDVKPASANVTIPGTGQITAVFGLPGLSRTEGSSEVLTSPSAASTTKTLAAVQGRIVLNGALVAVTNINFTIDGAVSTGDPEVGSESYSDLQRGRITVTGSFQAKFTSQTIQGLRNSQAVIPLIVGSADSKLAGADFILFTFPAIKVMTDDMDDGEKIRIRTYNFTAQFNGDGGAGTATHQTIAQIHDSQAA